MYLHTLGTATSSLAKKLTFKKPCASQQQQRTHWNAIFAWDNAKAVIKPLNFVTRREALYLFVSGH
jgi:hypothetical protein